MSRYDEMSWEEYVNEVTEGLLAQAGDEDAKKRMLEGVKDYFSDYTEEDKKNDDRNISADMWNIYMLY